MPALLGTPAGAYDSSASAIPTISAANSAADGTPSIVRGTVTATVTTANTVHRIMITGMPLLIRYFKRTYAGQLPRYNLVMRLDIANATELRESIMALT